MPLQEQVGPSIIMLFGSSSRSVVICSQVLICTVLNIYRLKKFVTRWCISMATFCGSIVLFSKFDFA